jgi:UDP-2,4-diacetamido-2,4,6-trideoxy-beta-L-altropyranose hydrolase
LKPNIIIRADGGTSIGMGHIVRCIALADMLKNDFNIVFAIQKPVESVIKTIHTITQMIIHLPQTDDYTADATNFTTYLNTNDIVILDGYNFKTEYQKSIKDKGCKLVCIDDLHAWHQYADIVINHAEGIQASVYSTEDYTQLYLGLNYVLLRSPFLHGDNPNKKLNSIKKVFISMGASDIANNSGKFTEALISLPGIEEIHLMLGSINPNLNVIQNLIDTNKQVKIIPHFDISDEELRELLRQCDIAICPASSISLECCATGIGLISGYTAENQMDNLNSLDKRKTLVNFGDLLQLSITEIQTKISILIKHPEIFNDMIIRQKQMIDGKSPYRLLGVFKNL